MDFWNDIPTWDNGTWTTTDFASRERDIEKRNVMFLNAGKFLSNEVEKTLNKQKKYWSDNLIWGEVLQIAKK